MERKHIYSTKILSRIHYKNISVWGLRNNTFNNFASTKD